MIAVMGAAFHLVEGQTSRKGFQIVKALDFKWIGQCMWQA